MPLHRTHAPGIIRSAGLVKDGTPSDDAVPWGYTSLLAAGAAGDGTTDDTAALNAAWGSTTPLWIAGRRAYRITGTVTGNVGRQLVRTWGAEILYEGSGTALVIGSTTSSKDVARWSLPFVRKSSQSAWGGADIGIKFFNLGAFIMDIPGARGFSTGVQCRPEETNGSNYRWAYGIIKLGAFENCGLGLELDATSNKGWTNENIFFGGRFEIESGVNDSTARVGIREHSSTDGYEQANNKHWWAPVFKLNAAAASGSAIAIRCENASNSWTHAAMHDIDTDMEWDGGTSQGRWNILTTGYRSSATVVVSEVGGGPAAPSVAGSVQDLLTGPNDITAIGGVIS